VYENRFFRIFTHSHLDDSFVYKNPFRLLHANETGLNYFDERRSAMKYPTPSKTISPSKMLLTVVRAGDSGIQRPIARLIAAINKTSQTMILGLITSSSTSMFLDLFFFVKNLQNPSYSKHPDMIC